MDYPKSVPSVGLVGGKFVDENPVAGTPGSLIPAQWGNAVSDEILNVITAAGLTPDEMNNAQLSAAIASIIGSTRPIASQAEAETGTDNTKTMTPLRAQQAISKRAAVVGSSRNVRMSVVVASASATLTADEVFVKSALGGIAWLVPSFNKTINLATTGAGGMDTGTAPVSGHVAIYAIYNPTTATAALLAVNATAAVQPEVYGGANMPAGYTASALVSVWGTNASGQLNIGAQFDRSVSMPNTIVLTTSTVTGTAITPIVTAAFPRNAKSVSGNTTIAATALSSLSLAIYSSSVNVGQQVNNASVTGGSQNVSAFNKVLVSVPQTIFYTTGQLSGSGQTYTVAITSYEF